nr:Uma2 family endonuclease [Fortiea contorta]
MTKDLETKSKVYAEAGISEYWVVNLQKLYLVVFQEPLDGEYATKLTLTGGTIQPFAFPDISVSVEQIINR